MEAEEEREEDRESVGGRRSSAVERASIEPEDGSPRELRSDTNPVRQSIGERLASGARSLRRSIGRMDLSRLRQPVRVHESKWQRRGRRFLTLSLAAIGYILFLANQGSLGETFNPKNCNDHRVKSDLPMHCVRDGSLETCKQICNPSNPSMNVTGDCARTYASWTDSIMHRCKRDWVRNGTELALMLSLLCLTYMAMLGELTLATAKEDDSGAIKQTKVKWGRVAGSIWTVLVIFLLVSLPAVFSTETFKNSFGTSPQSVGQTSAMVFAVLSIMLSLREIIKHFLNWNCPTLQVHVVRVLFMVPVYAADAFGTLFVCSRKGGCENENGSFSELVLFLEVFREFYEAFTIYSFFRLLQEALRLEATLRRSGHGSTPYASLQDLGAGRSTAGDADGLAPFMRKDRGRQEHQIDTDLSSARDIGGANSVGDSRGSIFERVERMVGVDVPEDVAQLHNMLLLEVSDDARKHKWYQGCLCCLQPWPAGYVWLMRCRRGVLQYVLVEVVCAFAILLSRYYDWYGEPGYGGSNVENVTKYCSQSPQTDGSGQQGDEEADANWVSAEPDMHAAITAAVDWEKVYPYTTAMVSLSQLWALYCLIHFYYGTKQILARYAPGAKFVSIKLIVFFSFWQNMAITLWFSKLGSSWLHQNTRIDNDWLICWLNTEFQLSVGSFAAGAQALLICVEMFVASLVHRSVFSYRAFKRQQNAPGSLPATRRVGPRRAFMDALQDTTTMGTSSVQGSERSERSTSGWSRRTDGSIPGSRRTNGSMQGSAQLDGGGRRTNGQYSRQHRGQAQALSGAE